MWDSKRTSVPVSDRNQTGENSLPKFSIYTFESSSGYIGFVFDAEIIPQWHLLSIHESKYLYVEMKLSELCILYFRL